MTAPIERGMNNNAKERKMKIIQLTAENVKRITALTITPEGSMVVIGGDHGAGKSSVLDAIMYALAGKKALPPRPLRDGAKNGKVVLKLDGDESRHLAPMTVARTFTPNGGGTLEIRTEDGYAAPSPQTILDELCSRATFDPLGFTRLPPKQQAEQLRELVGLDFAELDRQRKSLFDDRTGINRAAKQLKARLDSAPYHDGLPEKEVAVSDLVAELRRRQAVNEQNAEQRRTLAQGNCEIASADRECRSVEQQMEALQKRLEAGREILAQKEANAKVQEATVASLQDLPIDECQQQIGTAEEANRKVRENATRKQLASEHAAACGKADGLTEAIENIDADKDRQLQTAKWPVEGLGFGDTGVTFKGLPFEQINTAEQLRISVAMGFALNPGLKTLLIREGSLMTVERLKLLGEIAAEHDGQLFVERVGEGAECSVIIEDGHLKAIEPAAETAAAA